jgi:5-methylcytosine-specific restriction endonuclease McrA
MPFDPEVRWRTKQPTLPPGQRRLKPDQVRKLAAVNRDSHTCYLCGCAVWTVATPKASRPGRAFGTLEHVRPKSRGGGNEPGNLRAACATCNVEKGDWTYTELLLGFRLEGGDVSPDERPVSGGGAAQAVPAEPPGGGPVPRVGDPGDGGRRGAEDGVGHSGVGGVAPGADGGTESAATGLAAPLPAPGFVHPCW